jgi:hypothetical protein
LTRETNATPFATVPAGGMEPAVTGKLDDEVCPVMYATLVVTAGTPVPKLTPTASSSPLPLKHCEYPRVPAVVLITETKAEPLVLAPQAALPGMAVPLVGKSVEVVPPTT